MFCTFVPVEMLQYIGGDQGCAEKRTTKYLRVYPMPDEPLMAVVTIKGAHEMF